MGTYRYGQERRRVQRGIVVRDEDGFTPGMHVEVSGDDGTERSTSGWRGFFAFAGAAFLGYALFVILVCLLVAVLLDGCGGVAEPETQAPPDQTAHEPAAEQREQHWCCRTGDTANDSDPLFCGERERPDFVFCYCAGVVHGTECEDTRLYTPGSTCTAAGLVCL